MITGDLLTLGIYPTPDGTPKPIQWIVLREEDNKAKIMTKDVLFRYGKYYSEDQDMPWKDSKIRRLLNQETYNIIFSEAEKQCVLESVTVDNERAIKNFYWDEKSYEDPVGIEKVAPVMTRDYLFLPAMKDLFEYELIPDKSEYKGTTYSMHQYKLKDERFAYETTRDKNEKYAFDSEIGYPLLNSIYDTLSWDTFRTPKYKRHMVIDYRGWELKNGIVWLRPCAWTDVSKYEALG